MWPKLLIKRELEGKTHTLEENEAVPSVFTSVRGPMKQAVTDEWAEVFRPKKILK